MWTRLRCFVDQLMWEIERFIVSLGYHLCSITIYCFGLPSQQWINYWEISINLSFFFFNLLLAKNRSKLLFCAHSKNTIHFTFKIYLMRIKFLTSWWKQNNSNEKQRWVKPDNMFWFISVKYCTKKSRLVQNNRGRLLKGNTFFQYYVKKKVPQFFVLGRSFSRFFLEVQVFNMACIGL